MATIFPISGEPREFDEVIVSEEGICFCYSGGGRSDEEGTLETVYIQDNVEKINPEEGVESESYAVRKQIGRDHDSQNNVVRPDYTGRIVIENIFR